MFTHLRHTVLILVLAVAAFSLLSHAHAGETIFLTGHESWVEVIAFSADGKWLATGSRDNTVKIWDAATGDCLRTLNGHRATVYAVAFSPDGKLVASGSRDHTVKFWDRATGECTRTLPAHADSVTGVAFSPDGRRLASAGGASDATVKIWDVESGLLAFPPMDSGVFVGIGEAGFNTGVSCLAFSQDGSRLASGAGLAATVWDAATGAKMLTLAGHFNFVTCVTFSPDGKSLTTGSADATARFWDSTSGRNIGGINTDGVGVSSVAFSPDGKLLAVASRNEVNVWDGSTRKKMITINAGGGVSCVAYSPDGTRLACAGETVAVCDAKGPPAGATLRPPKKHVASLAPKPANLTPEAVHDINWIILCEAVSDPYYLGSLRSDRLCYLAQTRLTEIRDKGSEDQRAVAKFVLDALGAEAVAALERSQSGFSAAGQSERLLKMFITGVGMEEREIYWSNGAVTHESRPTISGESMMDYYMATAKSMGADIEAREKMAKQRYKLEELWVNSVKPVMEKRSVPPSETQLVRIYAGRHTGQTSGEVWLAFTNVSGKPLSNLSIHAVNNLSTWSAYEPIWFIPSLPPGQTVFTEAQPIAMEWKRESDPGVPPSPPDRRLEIEYLCDQGRMALKRVEVPESLNVRNALVDSLVRTGASFFTDRGGLFEFTNVTGQGRSKSIQATLTAKAEGSAPVVLFGQWVEDFSKPDHHPGRADISLKGSSENEGNGPSNPSSAERSGPFKSSVNTGTLSPSSGLRIGTLTPSAPTRASPLGGPNATPGRQRPSEHPPHYTFTWMDGTFTLTTQPFGSSIVLTQISPATQKTNAAPKFTTEAEAQKVALERYPDLAVPGSKLNTEFVSRHKLYQQQRPAYFQDPSWPIRLAEEITSELK